MFTPSLLNSKNLDTLPSRVNFIQHTYTYVCMYTCMCVVHTCSTLHEAFKLFPFEIVNCRRRRSSFFFFDESPFFVWTVFAALFLLNAIKIFTTMFCTRCFFEHDTQSPRTTARSIHLQTPSKRFESVLVVSNDGFHFCHHHHHY